MEGYSVRQLAQQSRHSPRTLSRLLAASLAQTPPPRPVDVQHRQYLLFDGTFLHRPTSIAVLMDAPTRTLVRGQYGVSERSAPQLRAFFAPLVQAGLQPRSVTVDGNPHVLEVLRALWPDAVIQRCLVHIQRQGVAWCRRSPKTPYARQLRDLFLQVPHIRTVADRDAFLEQLAAWEETYGAQIQSRRETGPVFSDVKRARSMLLRALPDMFHYLANPRIPPTTNGLEGYFSRLKAHYRQHRGLRSQKRPHYFAWYFHLVPK